MFGSFDEKSKAFSLVQVKRLSGLHPGPASGTANPRTRQTPPEVTLSCTAALEVSPR